MPKQDSAAGLLPGDDDSGHDAGPDAAGQNGAQASAPPAAKREREYTVVARRYRPQAFAELVGQEHVARALSGAILSNRVGHAYLFTGARGVGKTSAARILAKCLNCERGPAAVPCDQCDSCLAIASGDDVDVLEIDGASNRGIEEMRELRHNVGIRPSRSRFKIYIIDEVHMLTREAFNALLKTLEEPPEHVKFIFCTTEAEKIPVTILSRCQRFDFAGIQAASIVGRLQQIVAAEGVEAEPEALALLSRRAGGSMRDSQSLLEQLLSLGAKRITVTDVNQMLGSASDERLGRLLNHLVAREAGEALAELDSVVAEGVDVGQLLDQLLLYCRDVMVASVGGRAETLLHTDAATVQLVGSAAQALGVQTVLAMMQILDHTIGRMRYSTQRRVLAELALVRICQLADLDELPALIASLKGADGPAATGAASSRPALARPTPAAARPAPPAAAPQQSPAPAEAKKKEPDLSEPELNEDEELDRANAALADADDSSEADSGAEDAGLEDADAVHADASARHAEDDEAPLEAPPARPFAAPLTPADAQRFWQAALPALTGMLAAYAGKADKFDVRGDDFLVATFPKNYNSAKVFCEKPEALDRIAAAVSEAAGRPVRIGLVLSETASETAAATPAAPRTPQRERVRDKSKHPLVARAIELFDARPVKVDE
jgi:DNA polymerase-3 subunit gamma/tau